MSNQYLSFDVTKQSAPQQLITGRQGDSRLKFVSVLLWDGEKNIPYDLTGKQIAFEALKPDGTHIVDYNGITILDAPHGLFRYSFNEQVFSVAGTMQQAFFKITHTDSDNNVIADSTLEVSINILENRVEFGINSKDYLSEYDDLIAQVKKKFDDYAATVQDSIDKAQALHDQIVEYTNLINSKGVILRSEFGDISSIKQPLGQTVVDKLNNEFNDRGVNVKWFGAKGDGVTDDSDAIQAAINTGSSVFVPAGTYLITKTISLKLQNFIGAGSNQTFFNVQNADLFELSIGGRTIAEVANFRVESIGDNAKNNSVFKSKEDSKQRATTYHFHDIEINGGQFLYGFNLTDSFRITINKIGMTNVFNPFLLRGQVVQTTIDDVICNIDTTAIGALNDYNTGIKVVGDSHSGSYQRPESVRMNNVSFVGYDLGYNIQDVLYFVSDKFECDYCTIGIRTFSTDGGVAFTNGWIAVQNRRNTPSIGIDVLTSVKNVLKPIVFDNLNISGLSGLDSESVAFRVGYDEDQSSWFKKGVTAHNLWISAADSKFKYAVQANRAKTLTLDGIKVATDTAQTDFYLVNCELYSLKNLDGQTASVTTGTPDDSIIENCNIPNLEILGAYPQYYNNDGLLRTSNRSIKVTSTDVSENYTHNLSVNSGSLWVNSAQLMYKFGDPTSNTDGSRVIRVADVTSLPSPGEINRGDIYTLKGATDKVYMCVYQENAFVWKQLI